MHQRYKIYLAVVILLLAALACDISPSDSQPVEQGAVNTQVAQTMAAQGSVETQVAQTVEAQGAVETRVAQTVEAQAGAQDETSDSQPPEDQGDQQDAPAEPAATTTSTPAPTKEYKPVIGVRDWNLLDPDELYDFKINQLMFDYDGPNDRAEFKDGEFAFSIDDPISFDLWTFSWIEDQDYYFEITVKFPEQCSGKDRAGIIFRTPLNSYDVGYIFQISCDGHYRLKLQDGINNPDLISWLSSNSINQGGGSINRIGVWVKNSLIHMFVNADEITNIMDGTFQNKGKVGLVIGVESTKNFEVRFDDAAYWYNP